MNLNKVFLIGRLGKTPETKTFQNGGRICIINLGVNDPYYDKQKDHWVQNPSWIRVVFQDKIADRAMYLKKGDEILVEGKVKPRSFEDKEGNTRVITEIKGTFKKGRKGNDKDSEGTKEGNNTNESTGQLNEEEEFDNLGNDSVNNSNESDEIDGLPF